MPNLTDPVVVSGAVATAITLLLTYLHSHGKRLPLVEYLLDLIVRAPDLPSVPGMPLLNALDRLQEELRRRLPHPDDNKPLVPVVTVLKTEGDQLHLAVTLPK